MVALCVFSLFSSLAAQPASAEDSSNPLPEKAPDSLQTGNTEGFVAPPLSSGYQVKSWNGLETVLPSKYDWRNYGDVTSVKDQANCGDCYVFAGVGDFESKLLMGGQGSNDLSENNVRNCSWYTENNYSVGGCTSGNAEMVADVLAEQGSVLESCDPYVDSEGSCNTSCAHQYSLRGMNLISGSSIPDTTLLKNYLLTYGPLYTSMYSGFSAFHNYNGNSTLYYSGTEYNNHAVLIVGWDDSLAYSTGHGTGHGAWIVKNSWGTSWGKNGFFTIAYGSAGIGEYTSYVSDWQKFDNHGQLYYLDEAGWTSGFGYRNGATPTIAWGMNLYYMSQATYAKDVEFWMNDAGSADVYLYDGFDGNALGNLLGQKVGVKFNTAGYHSIAFDSPISLPAGHQVAVVVKLTNASYEYPLTVDTEGPSSYEESYISSTGNNGSWEDLGGEYGDSTLRLRTTNNPNNKADQSITVTKAAPATAGYNSQFTVAATASSGLAVTYSTNTPGVCSVSGSTYTLLTSSGTCTVLFDQAGNASYLSADEVSENVSVTLGTQTITQNPAPPPYALWGTQFTVAATSTSGNTVVFSSGSTDICTNVDGTFTMKSGTTGVCVVQLSAAGNSYYNAAQKTDYVLVTENVPPQVFLPSVMR